MFAITGITGQVGGAVARSLLQQGHKVRAVVRDAAKGAAWAARGCEVAVATATDGEALASAFAGTDGVFLMIPPDYDPEPGFPAVRATAAAFRAALDAARPGRAVYLSTVGAHVAEFNLLNNAAIIETALRGGPTPVGFLRPAWFMENAAWAVDTARRGMIDSYLQPPDHAIPMVATADIGATAADLLTQRWDGARVVELGGPDRYSANDIAATFGRLLGRPVETRAVPRETWEAQFRAQGQRHPLARMRMLDGFNEGWLDFAGGGAESRAGATSLETVLSGLLATA